MADDLIEVIEKNIDNLMSFLCKQLQTLVSLTQGDKDFLAEFFATMDADNSSLIDKEEFLESFITTLLKSFEHPHFSFYKNSIISN